jgi:hypothetical protein
VADSIRDDGRIRRDDADRADLRAAYERGRADARASRKRHPIGMTLLFVAAAVGAILLALALTQGSFSGAGQTVDQGLNVAADKAEPVVRDAAADASRTVNDAVSR